MSFISCTSSLPCNLPSVLHGRPTRPSPWDSSDPFWLYDESSTRKACSLGAIYVHLASPGRRILIQLRQFKFQTSFDRQEVSITVATIRPVHQTQRDDHLESIDIRFGGPHAESTFVVLYLSLSCRQQLFELFCKSCPPQRLRCQREQHVETCFKAVALPTSCGH